MPLLRQGCNLTLHVQDGEIVTVSSPDDHDITRGTPHQGSFRFQHVKARELDPVAESLLSLHEHGRAPGEPGTAGAVRVTVVENGEAPRRDRVVTEEPFEIRVAGPGEEAVSVVVTMRTPGADMELAAGFLFTEGLVGGPDEIEHIRYCGLEAGQEQDYNVVTVHLRRPFDRRSLQRNFYATSSCGVWEGLDRPGRGAARRSQQARLYAAR